MYERSAIVLERYFEELLGNNNKNNLKTNFQNYSDIVEEMTQYDALVTEEEKVISKFDEVAGEIQTIQTIQEKLHKSNENIEEERNNLFSDLDQNPNSLDNKLKKIENTFDKNNEQLKDLIEKYVKALDVFIERQKERNKYTRNRREKEAEHIKNVENANKTFKEIDYKIVQELRKFINEDDEDIKEEIVNIMMRNGKSEKVGFNEEVIRKAVEVRMDIAKREAKCYVEIYEKTKRFLNEIDSENLKLAKYEKLLKNTTVILTFLEAEKEYIIGFLDNERMNAFSGAKIHKKMMEEACKNFEADIVQIDNLYEIILKETTNKATKKIYKDLYNKTYLRDIEENERSFEKEMTNVKTNVGTLINSNYWRMERIKNIYEVFEEEITEKFEKDLSEFKIEEKPVEINIEENNRKKSKKQGYDYEEDEDYYEYEEEDDDDDEDDEYYIEDNDEDKYKYDDDEEDDYYNDYDDEDEDEYDYDYEDDEEDYDNDEDNDYNYDDDDEYEDDEEEYSDEDDYDEDEDDDYYIEDNDDYDDEDEDEYNDENDEEEEDETENKKNKNAKKKTENKNNKKNVKNAKKEDKKFLNKIFGNKNKGKRMMEK